MRIIIKSDKIRWIKNVVRIQNSLKIEIGPTVHDIWDSHIYVNT